MSRLGGFVDAFCVKADLDPCFDLRGMVIRVVVRVSFSLPTIWIAAEVSRCRVYVMEGWRLLLTCHPTILVVEELSTSMRY